MSTQESKPSKKDALAYVAEGAEAVRWYGRVGLTAPWWTVSALNNDSLAAIEAGAEADEVLQAFTKEPGHKTGKV